MSDPIEEILHLTAELLRIDSSQNPEEALRWIRTFLDRGRIPHRVLFPRTSHPVLLAGATEGRVGTVIATHLDTVPSEVRPRARPGTRRSGRLQGRGSLDMKGALVMSLVLLRESYLTMSEPPPLTLVVTTDEERESRGAWRLVDQGILAPDIVLVPEPTWERTALGAVGRRCWRVTFTSPGGHAEGNFDRGGNPASAVALLLSRLPSDFSPLEIRTEGAGEVSLPHRASCRVDQVMRTQAGEGRARELLTVLIEASERRYEGTSGSFTLMPRASPWPPPYAVDRKHVLVQGFLESVTRASGKTERIVEQAVGDFNAYGSRWPTLVYGPGGHGAHGRDEWVDLASLERCYAAYRDFLERWVLGSTRPRGWAKFDRKT